LLHAQRDDFSPERSDPTSVLQGPPENQKRERTQHAPQLSQSTYVSEGGVGSSAGSCFLQELIPVEVCVLNAGALICSKEKKKKKKKKSSLKHSQRRQKLCQRVQGEK